MIGQDVWQKSILDALRAVTDPVSGQDIVQCNMVQGLSVREGKAQFALELHPNTPASKHSVIKACAEKAVLQLRGIDSVSVILTAERTNLIKGIAGINHIIAIASAKGGVGKSTTAINLALALRRCKVSVGIMDADVFGPSLPRMLGVNDTPDTADDSILIPLEGYGIKAMSMGFLVEEDKAVIWRGPMVMRAIKKILEDVAWGDLDILVVDMPPGTGDTHLTIAQSVPLRGAVIVSTPQDIALIDARKGISMFKKVNVPILGIVENMSTFSCPHCQKESYIFGSGGAKREAKKMGVPFLGEVPLHIDIRKTSDRGLPIVATKPDSPQANRYVHMAEQLLSALDVPMYKGQIPTDR